MLFRKKNTIYICFLFLISISNFGWAQNPPKLTALGNQPYCPSSQIPIVSNFNISNPDNVAINTVYIQISEGYINGEDTLKLIGTHPNITPEPFNSQEGKLVLKWTSTTIANNAELVNAIENVIFESNSPTPTGSKIFSITIGEAN